MHTFAIVRRACIVSTCAVAALLTVGRANADSIKPKPKLTAAERAFNRGKAALDRADWREAEVAFQEVLKLDKKAAPAMLGLAKVASERGDRKAASAYLQQAFTVAPDDPIVQRDWAKYQFVDGNAKDAEKALRTAVQLDASSAGTRVDLGDLFLMAFQKPADAVPFYKQAIALEPNHAGAHYALGVAYAMSGNDRDSVQELTKAATLSPANPLPYYQLGRVQLAKRRLPEALDAFTKSLTISPLFALALVGKGEVFLAKGDQQQAIAAFQSAAKADPSSAVVQLELGMVYQGRNQLADAEAAYRKAIQLDDRQAIAYNNLAWMCAERKTSLNEALAWGKKAVSLAPAASQFQTTLGWVQRARGEFAAATVTLTKATVMNPQRADGFYYLGVALLDQGKRTEGSAALKKALALDPKFGNAADAQQRLKTLS